MAAPLSQDEIDALLNSTDEFDSMEDDSPMDSGDFPDEAPARKGGTKNFNPIEVPAFRFKFNYNSPIVKSSAYRFNPEDDKDTGKDENDLVVRSIFNYASMKKRTG